MTTLTRGIYLGEKENDSGAKEVDGEWMCRALMAWLRQIGLDGASVVKHVKNQKSGYDDGPRDTRTSSVMKPACGKSLSTIHKQGYAPTKRTTPRPSQSKAEPTLFRLPQKV